MPANRRAGGDGRRPKLVRPDDTADTAQGAIPGSGAGARLGVSADRSRSEHTADAVARAAWEAGYFPETQGERPTPDQLLEAIREELAGRPRHAEHMADDRAIAEQEAVDALDELLNRLGIDASEATNGPRSRRRSPASPNRKRPTARLSISHPSRKWL